MPLYLSLESNGSVGGVAASDEDILWFDGATWSLYFDGSDVGVAGVDLDAFYILNANTILMSFDKTVAVNGLSIDNRDIVAFTGTLGPNTSGSFSMFFGGDAHELTTSQEDVDAIGLLPDGRLLISTAACTRPGSAVA